MFPDMPRENTVYLTLESLSPKHTKFRQVRAISTNNELPVAGNRFSHRFQMDLELRHQITNNFVTATLTAIFYISPE